MSLVQIDLRRRRDPRPVGPSEGPRTSGVAPGAPSGLALGVGVILLVPLAGPALSSDPVLALLLVGLGVLGLIAALLRPGQAGDTPP